MEEKMRLFNSIMLLGIFLALILILIKMPVKSPTIGDVIKAQENDTEFEKLHKKIPYFGTVDVDVITYPLEVEVTNDPLVVSVRTNPFERNLNIK